MRGRPVRVYVLFKVVAFPTLRGVGPCLVMSAGLPLDRAVAEVVDPLPLGKRGVEDAPARVLGEWAVLNCSTTGILCHNSSSPGNPALFVVLFVTGRGG